MRIKLAYPLRLGEIAKATGGFVSPKFANKSISYIATDSREIFKGDLFIALKGENHDGENYVHDVIKKEAFHFSKSEKAEGVRILDTRNGLLRLAAYYKTKFKHLKHTVAITGSVGKTTTKEFLKVILSTKYATHATYKNLNNNLGVPLTVFAMPKRTEILVVEMGMNCAGEISKSSICASPDISIILNVGNSHIGKLGSRESIALAKLEVLDGMSEGTLLVPHSEPLLNINPKVTFDLKNKDADYHFSDDLVPGLYYKDTPITDINFKFSDRHLRECLIAAASCAHLLGLPSHELHTGISSISDENIRQRIIRAEDFYFLADFYNASPESVSAALDSLFSLPSYQRKSVLLGDILELGNKSEDLHQEIGKAIAKYNFYNLYLFGKYSKNICDGALNAGFPKSRIYLNENSERPDITARQIRNNHTRGEIILIKGSRGMRLERILDQFEITDKQI